MIDPGVAVGVAGEEEAGTRRGTLLLSFASHHDWS
jgi:hypothetical protein